ncbi:MAG: rRNA maturation RNase YbeY [Candidatus Omnitrophica bacterium]|nr:rRNA maturation RNase YbeY [Candidatus Omnitrophota bacterium]MBU4488759.1 rRNA maturation RNase YbeY [Candidatus Omnitrophota bacterium]MCG2705856.1 rRNA maturation RNase YbeY [Candidatus Omnitrophota bacterium]
MIHLRVSNISRCRFLNAKKLEKVVVSILRKSGVRAGELSIVFATDSEIRPLNKKYRQKDRPTDVLSFSLGEEGILGDIVISVDRARAQAKAFGTSFKDEIELYIIHGVLHILGYDDEAPPERKVMRKKEKEYLTLWRTRR